VFKGIGKQASGVVGIIFNFFYDALMSSSAWIAIQSYWNCVRSKSSAPNWQIPNRVQKNSHKSSHQQSIYVASLGTCTAKARKQELHSPSIRPMVRSIQGQSYNQRTIYSNYS
jgi:hypothetical protein